MIWGAICNSLTGKIESFVSGSEDEVRQAASFMRKGYAMVSDDFDRNRAEDHYVVNGQVVPRPENPANLVLGLLTNVPVPSVLVIDGVEHANDGTTVQLKFADIGRYKVTLRCWPYKDKTFEVIA